jgi:hypothetical protein
MSGEDQTRIDKPVDSTQTQESVTPEIEALVEAAVSSLVGDKVHIRSVNLVEKSEAATTWAIEGRVAVHSSHNQRVTHG